MKLTLVSHASVIVDTGDVRLWTDPWLSGTAFNDSWRLLPEAAWDAALLDGVDYLWISHEHPDHFHIPTLRSLPEAFKQRVTVLFQQNNSDKMFRAFAQFGFTRWRALPHRAVVPLTSSTRVYCYQEGQMNSCLAVLDGERVMLDVNDAEVRTEDCRLIVKDIGRCEVVLNQFSIAGYAGLEDRERRLRAMARGILENMVDNHRDLGARTTIPFASFVYFSTVDNRYVNAFANRPADVARHFAEQGLELAVLYPGDVFECGVPYDSRRALHRFDACYERFGELSFVAPPRVELAEIRTAFESLHAHLAERFPPLLLWCLRPVVIEIADLGITVEFHVASGRIREVTDSQPAHLLVNSQPLLFAFKYPYGVQTLGVSARFVLKSGIRNWQAHRVLFAMNNAEFYLRPKYLLTARSLGYVAGRFRGAMGQLARRLQAMV